MIICGTNSWSSCRALSFTGLAKLDPSDPRQSSNLLYDAVTSVCASHCSPNKCESNHCFFSSCSVPNTIVIEHTSLLSGQCCTIQMADPQKKEEVKQSFLQSAKKWGGPSRQLVHLASIDC